MKNQPNLCQSCGMPLDQDPKKGGTNADGSLSSKYCSYCYQDGRFLDEGTTLQEKIDKNVQLAISMMNMPESKAREMAENILPNLERWKS